MLPSKHLSWLMVAWLFAMACTAKEPSFPRPTEDDEASLKNQYVIQFYGRTSIEAFLKGAGASNWIEEVVRYIPKRKIIVAKFFSEKAAARWKSKATRIVKYFEKDSIVYLDRISSPGPYQPPTRKLAETTPYGITYVKAEEVSDANSGSIKVCIVDSGYDLGHPDLPSGSTVTGESFVNGYDWSTDERGHGTHVAGTIAALGGNGIGVKGVIRNGNVKLHIVKVFGDARLGEVYTSTILAGFQSCIDNGADVVNMSLGGAGTFAPFQDAINDAYNNYNMLIFASSGNNDSFGYNYPASYDNVISVASIDSSYTRSSFPPSTYSDKVDICAPGSNVLSTVPRGGYALDSGTSMACPHAVGVAALVWSNYYPTLSHEALENILVSTAQDLPLNSNDGYDIYYGHGLINAKDAFDEVQNRRLAPKVVEGKAYKCRGDSNPHVVYRFTQGELRPYPNPQIASSWDPNWRSHHRIVCTGIPKGPRMPHNAVEGKAYKCNVDSNPHALYRFTQGELRPYPSPQIASSWDPNWGSYHMIDCTGIPKGPRMPHNYGLVEGKKLDEGDFCPSKRDDDCAGSLKCGMHNASDTTYICCKNTYSYWFLWDVCV